ncbi:MAG: N-acetyltransferase [Candidatus Omnitrophica bacterium]|nr:N-acetyltransferase [Candidatus Omnitrophota bacterium]
MNTVIDPRKVSLRKVTSATLSPHAHEWLNDPEVKRFLFNVRHHHYHYEDCKQFIEQAYAVGRPHWGVFVEDVHVGNISSHKWLYADRWLDLTFLIGDRTYWGKGLGTLSAAAAIRYFFRKGFHRIQCGVFSKNQAACSMLEKLGFKKEGVSRETALFENRYLDIVHYGLLETEWKPSPGCDVVFVEDLIHSEELKQPALNKQTPMIY